MRKLFAMTAVGCIAFILLVGYFRHHALWALVVIIPVALLGFADMFQRKQTIRRNFPVIGHFRYLFEMIRPEINQYFIESNKDGVPFNREARSLIYQRAKGVTDTLPFGTQSDVYATGYEWINHSIAPHPILHQEPRVMIGGPGCSQPYSASLFNVSAMSYGSLSQNAVLALNAGAKKGGFYHNTGEGGLSPYHLKNGGDIVWQIGTGYFGARNHDGSFSDTEFEKRAKTPNVKMIEIKLSQGAKPGHGGILPAKKLTPEIAAIRGVPLGQDVLSPPQHSTFKTPLGLIQFVEHLRKLSGGKPVGFKLCLGRPSEFLGIIKAMVQLNLTPDFITVDGGEGGTGAAPLEFSNWVGTPLNDALSFVHGALVGAGLRERVKVIASGKVTTGFTLAAKIALGADICNSARGMMFALGCVQALRCNTNACPTGVATQDPELTAGLDVVDKSARVANFHRITVHSFLEVLAATGLNHPRELRPWHIQRRVSPTDVLHYGEIYACVMTEPGALLKNNVPAEYSRPWHHSHADRF